MALKEIIFDSRNEAYKSPVGAVRSGTELRFRIRIKESLAPSDVDLMVLCDRDNSLAAYMMEREGTEGDYLVFRACFPIIDRGLYFYWFEFETPEGRRCVRKNGPENEPVMCGASGESWQQTVYLRDYEVPEFIEGGAFYHIFVDRFFHGGSEWIELPGKKLRRDWGGLPEYRPDPNGITQNNDFFGGDLRGVIEKLPYIQSLGVSCIYLSPIFEAFSNHKYDTADYFRIDPMFGTLEDFRELCAKAKDMGISVILDGVFSHTGCDSVYFNKFGHYGGGGAYKDPDSVYRGWYYFRPDGSYESWWGFDTLPRVNKLNEDYIDFICGENGVARYWIRQGASGWRLDVADELPNLFIDRLCAAVKAERKDAIIVGEVWDDASSKISYSERKNYFEGDRLDSVMNYPLKDGLLAYMRSGRAEELSYTVETLLEHYPKEVTDCLMNIIDSHDTMRILTVLGLKNRRSDISKELQAITQLSAEEYKEGKALLMKASALQYTLPGVPCLYYADEAGMEGYADPFNRRCYPWGSEDAELLEWYKKLGSFRRSHPVYKDGSCRTLLAADGAYAFIREGNGEAVITAVNIGKTAQSFELPSEGLCRWRDALSGETLTLRCELVPGALMLLERLQG